MKHSSSTLPFLFLLAACPAWTSLPGDTIGALETTGGGTDTGVTPTTTEPLPWPTPPQWELPQLDLGVPDPTTGAVDTTDGSVPGDSTGGPAIDLGEGYETYWAYIGHFIHAPFYVYAYAFGDCLVNSLYAVYEKADSGFAERYLAMLAAGGTKHHSELLKPFGLDARDPSFWQTGLKLISSMIDEIEKLDKAV